MFRSKKTLVVGLSLAASMALFHEARQQGLFDVDMSPSSVIVGLRETASRMNPLAPNAETYHDWHAQDSRQPGHQLELSSVEELAEPARMEQISLTPLTTDEKDTTRSSQPVDPHPGRQLYVTNKFSYSGMGNKLADALFGIQYAKDYKLMYLFNYESFVDNPRNADHRWAADLLASRYPRYNDTEHQFYRVDDLYGIPHMSVEDQNTHDGYFIDRYTTCGQTDCFNPGASRHLNIARDLQDLFGVTAENREYRVTIHLRFGDVTHYLEPMRYLRIVEGLDKKYGSQSADGAVSLMDRVHVVYYVSDRSQPRVIDEIKALLPKAEFHNEANVETTMRFLANSDFLITSPSSLSYMSAYMCGGCHVVYTKPKEWTNTVMTQENYMNDVFYVDGWEPEFEYI